MARSISQTKEHLNTLKSDFKRTFGVELSEKMLREALDKKLQDLQWKYLYEERIRHLPVEDTLTAIAVVTGKIDEVIPTEELEGLYTELSKPTSTEVVIPKKGPKISFGSGIDEEAEGEDGAARVGLPPKRLDGAGEEGSPSLGNGTELRKRGRPRKRDLPANPF